MLGYYTKSKTVMPLSDSRKDTLDIGDIELKMSSQISSWSDFRHHYVGLTFTYHLDAKKKD